MAGATVHDDELIVPDSLEHLLREADLAAGAAPDEVSTAASASASAVAVSRPGPAADLVGYLACAGCFVGAGLVSGGLVHLPLDRSRYVTLALVGVVVFLTATLVQEVLLAVARPARARLARVVGGSLLLSLGIGMLSGGVQHFSEFPQRSAVLVPVGLVVSFLGFAVRAGCRRHALLGRRTAVVAVAAVLTFAGLQWLAGTAPSAPGHAHGTTPAAPAVGTGPVAQPEPSAPARSAPAPSVDDAALQRQLEELERRLAELQQASRS